MIENGSIGAQEGEHVAVREAPVPDLAPCVDVCVVAGHLVRAAECQAGGNPVVCRVVHVRFVTKHLLRVGERKEECLSFKWIG